MFEMTCSTYCMHLSAILLHCPVHALKMLQHSQGLSLPGLSSCTQQGTDQLGLPTACGGVHLVLQAACKSAEVLPHLVATVQQSQSPEVQLLAAQTLRKHIPRFWRRLSQQVRSHLAAWRPF